MSLHIAGSLCVCVTLWFGWDGVVSVCGLRHCCSVHVGCGGFKIKTDLLLWCELKSLFSVRLITSHLFPFTFICSYLLIFLLLYFFFFVYNWLLKHWFYTVASKRTHFFNFFYCKELRICNLLIWSNKQMWGGRRRREGVVVHRRDSVKPLRGGRLRLVVGHGMKVIWP